MRSCRLICIIVGWPTSILCSSRKFRGLQESRSARKSNRSRGLPCSTADMWRRFAAKWKHSNARSSDSLKRGSGCLADHRMDPRNQAMSDLCDSGLRAWPATASASASLPLILESCWVFRSVRVQMGNRGGSAAPQPTGSNSGSPKARTPRSFGAAEHGRLGARQPRSNGLFPPCSPAGSVAEPSACVALRRPAAQSRAGAPA